MLWPRPIPTALYNSGMATDGNVAGIQQNGPSGGYIYSVIGSANHPITYVNWYDAARFTNWLYNGQPTTGGEGNGTTETGSYTLNGSNPNNVTRNANATWVIPTENEWYKAGVLQSCYQLLFSIPIFQQHGSHISPARRCGEHGEFLWPMVQVSPSRRVTAPLRTT